MDSLLKSACVCSDCSIRDGMLSLSRSAIGVCLITDNDDRLLGVVTDGDIRRALLEGADLGSSLAPFMRTDFLSVSVEAPRAEVLDLMRCRFIEQVPIVDKNRRLVGVHLLRQMLGASEKSNIAVIMAGGKGERLKPLTESIPKPMVRVAGRPILERIVLHLVGHGIRKIYISVNHLADQIERYFEDGKKIGCQIEYLKEEAPLGTGGSLSLLEPKPEAPFFVLNGDLVTQANVDEMLRIHTSEQNHVTVGIREFTHEIPFGCLEVVHGAVKSIVEKPLLSRTINAGIYIFSPGNLENIPRNSPFAITSLIESALADGRRVGVFPVDDDWVDVGRPDQLKKAQGR